MNRGWVFNLGLLGLAAAAGGALWWADHRERQSLEAEVSAQGIGRLQASEATRLRFRDKEGAEATLERRDGGTWRMTSPVDAAVEAPTVEALLKLLERRSERRIAISEEQLEEFGLAKPQGALEVESGHGKRQTLTAGGTTPGGGKRYVRLEAAGPVGVLSEQESAPLLRSVSDLREKRWMPDFPMAKVSRVELDHPKGRLVLAKQGEAWRLEAPFQDEASDMLARHWLDQLSRARATGFQQASPPEKGGWRLTLVAEGGETFRATVWNDGEQLLARREGDPDALRMSAALAQDLDKPPEQLLLLRPLPHRQPTRMELAYNNHRLAVDKGEKGWPAPAWRTVEEALTREGWQGAPPQERGEPLFTVTVDAGEKAAIIPFWEWEETFVLAPPGRPIHIRLTKLQSEELRGALEALTKDEKPAQKIELGATPGATENHPPPAAPGL
ncbi:MAG: DUF4340 domain-containing protein [Magnetococcales bacterium]|nr:DUF4340 domain-containing protein [Magnetococcales bacterium]